MSLRVALVDDHRLFREGLRMVLEGQPDLNVVAEASDAREAFGVVDAAKPDVVVLDVALPGIDGIEAARELVRRSPRQRVLMLSMHSDEAHVAHALAAGASGYALKDQSADAVIDAIRTVARGQKYLSPRISRFGLDEKLHLSANGGENGKSKAGPGGPVDLLSPREREVFAMLVRGSSNHAVATRLCISIKTVETHRAHILKKLTLHSIADLVRFAARNGLLAL